MFHYKIKLSKDWNKQINHVVVTNLIEKGTSNFIVKSRGFGREMEIISNKEIEADKIFHLGKYHDGELKCKIVEKNYISVVPVKDKVTVSGIVSYSFVKTSDNREYCPIDIKTSKIIEPERLNDWIEKTMGIKPSSIEVKGIPKTILSPKLIIFNQFFLKVEGEVIDKDKVEMLQFQSIGKRKSYGLGWMDVN